MYEIPLKTSQKPDAGERTGKRYISCVTARPIRVIIVKKLNSLKHLVRTNVAELGYTTKTANIKKALLLSSTSPFSQCAAPF